MTWWIKVILGVLVGAPLLLILVGTILYVIAWLVVLIQEKIEKRKDNERDK